MTHLIDVKKLIAKIVELRKELPDTIEHLNDEESGFARGQQYELTAIEAEILCLQQEQPEPTCKTCGFYENNCPFIRGKLIPYPNKVCKDYTYSAMKEQKSDGGSSEKPNNHKGWSEEDEKNMKIIIGQLEAYQPDRTKPNPLYEQVLWLKSLPERFNLQPKQEWSETDKLHLNNAILVAKKEWGVNSYTARWLESLRDNYKKCNSRWKPSEEQMAALLNAEGLVRANNYPENAKILASLYEDLKKL